MTFSLYHIDYRDTGYSLVVSKPKQISSLPKARRLAVNNSKVFRAAVLKITGKKFKIVEFWKSGRMISSLTTP